MFEIVKSEWFTTWIYVSGSMYALSSTIGDVMASETRKNASKWLKGLEEEGQTSRWIKSIDGIFDKVYTAKHVSFQCFFRSCLTSIISLTVVVALLYGFHPELIGQKDFQPLAIIAFLFILNFGLDYLSLLETRWLLKVMAKTKSLILQTSLLSIDFLLTSIIFLVPFILFVVFIMANTNPGIDFLNTPWTEAYPAILKSFYRDILTSNEMNNVRITFLAPFFSTFSTTFWTLTYALSGLITKLITSTKVGVKFANRHLEIDKKPFKSMGMILISLFTILYGVFWVIEGLL